MSEPTTSHGPDRCRGNLECRDLHDPGGDLPDAQSSLSQCCCCDPCRYIRPNTILNTDQPVPTNYCCRCVPRGILLTFVPDDPEGECCDEFIRPMFWTRDGYLSVYSGSLFGVAVTATLGRDEYDACVWNVTAVSGGYPIFSESYEVDHYEVTCLAVPSVEIETEGPNGCDGKLILEDLPKAKLAFRERQGPDYPGYNFADLYPECGECTQVCTRICVDGQRHADQEAEKAEFRWFEEDGTRGWRHVLQPDDQEGNEEILLEEDEYGQCWLVPNLETYEDPEIFDPIPIGGDYGGCSCQLYEVFSTVVDEETITFSIRCGQCTCWYFHCGTCRCIPRELCVVLIEGSAGSRHVLEWDAEQFRWGDDYDALRLYLEPNEAGDCVITAEVTGYYGLDLSYTLPCTDESITNMFDPDSDVLSFTLEEPEERLTIVASSLLGDCAQSPCDEATPCNEECGGHPEALTVTIRQWSLPGDTSGYPVDCSVEVTVHFWQTADYYEAGIGVKYSCGYIGWLELGGDCCPVKVTLRNGTVTVWTPEELNTPSCEATSATEIELTTEECDPYYAQSDVLLGVHILDEMECMDCEDQSYRAQVTVTEVAA